MGEAGPRREEFQGQLLCYKIFGFDCQLIRPDYSCLTSLCLYPPFRTAGLVRIFLMLSSFYDMINEMHYDNIADIDTSEADWIK